MIATITGQLEAASDLLFRSSRRRGNVMESLPYVPGSAIRGALAARWLEHTGSGPDPVFRRLFHSGDVRFCHARATIDGDEAFTVPLTLHTDKHRPFAAGTTTVDLLVADTPASQGVLDRVHGEMTVDGKVRPGRGAATVTRTRIGTFRPQAADDLSEPARARGAQQGLAAEEQLFTEVRLAAGTRFLTRIEGPEDALAQLDAILQRDEDVLAIGRSRTVMGHMVATWSAATREAAPRPAAGDVHTVTALSDLVLLDRYQRSVTVLDAEALADLLGCETGMVEVLPGGHSRTTHIGGWDGVNAMPTHIDLAIRAGSAVRFRAPQEAVAQFAADPWVGWRRAEGHGRIAIDWAGHRPASYQRLAAATAHAPAAPGLDIKLAEAAMRIAKDLNDALNDELTPTLWNQVEDAVRRGEQLRAPDLESIEEGHVRAQSEAGRGGGRGRLRRQDRAKIVTHVTGAFDGTLAGTNWPALTHPQQVELAEHIGREVRLLELRRRAAARRRREYGVQHHGERPDA